MTLYQQERPDVDPIERYLPVESYHSKEGIREYYDIKDDIEMNTKEGELHLLEKMRDKHKKLNGRLDEAHDYVARLYRQHQVWDEVKDGTREIDPNATDSFESESGEEVGSLQSQTNERRVSKPQMEKQKGFFSRHPILTGTALALLAYFYGPTLIKNGIGVVEDALSAIPFGKVGDGIRTLFGVGGGMATGRPPIVPTPKTL